MTDPATLRIYIGSDQASFSQLLLQLSNPDTAQRTEAEVALGALKERWPEAVVVKLVEIVKSGNTPDIKGFAATLLRRVRA